MTRKKTIHTLHLVSHTHWDREWYLPFQLFRLKLVSLVDNLLELLKADSGYKHFTLDGQTIILDDYLQLRPENEVTIRSHVKSGRLLIGPWHILPDEFLVSPEATIRNLLQGDRTARRFGSKMNLGYIPDPFGHIGQMPQMLHGFGIHDACLQRGVADLPCEFWWQAPDGSRVLVANLRDGYMNAVNLPTKIPNRFIAEILRLRDSLLPYAATSHLLFMHGNDHVLADPDTSQAIEQANAVLNGNLIVHSSLPAYMHAVRSEISDLKISLPIVEGELRSSKRHHLLPGVLSTRLWIKQRNHACETLLEKWAEPFTTFLATVIADKAKFGPIILRYAWRLLMECHPHDSICGCSVDQVHAEMRPRFDQVEQIGEEIARQSLTSLAAEVDTQSSRKARPGSPDAKGREEFSAVVVFNPSAAPRSDVVTFDIELPPPIQDFEIVDDSGEVVLHKILASGGRQLLSVKLDRGQIESALHLVHRGQFADMAVQDAHFGREKNDLKVTIILSKTTRQDTDKWERMQQEFLAYLSDAEITAFHITARTPSTLKVRIVANGIPGCGYSTYWIRERPQQSQPPATALQTKPPLVIENDFFQIAASDQDGALEVRDKRSGATFSGLNRFVDGGDAGDEYNYSPPKEDQMVSPTKFQKVLVCQDDVEQTLKIEYSLKVPSEIKADRQSRSSDTATLSIISLVTLRSGVPRIDIHTEVDNGTPPIRDHRLRVNFPAPFSADYALHDGHFEVVGRPVGIQDYDDGWTEQPRPEVPQRAFTSVSNGKVGITLANRGLPEVEVLKNASGNLEIALTLLRCVGWLSREDLTTRRGHAGPLIATPEAQMPGSYCFDYSIIPHSGNWKESFRDAYAFHIPLRAAATHLHTGRLPAKSSFLLIDCEDFVLSAAKISEDGEGWILRGYNVSSNPINVCIKPMADFSRAAKASLAEEIQDFLPIRIDNSVTVSARAHEIITVKFW